MDFNYYKKHYSIIACDLSRQKALDPNPKIALQLEIVFMLGDYSQILTILEKSKKTDLQFSKGATKVLYVIIKMVEYNKINTKLSNVQLNKLKTAVKNNEGTTLRLGAKNFSKSELPYELFLTIRQINKLKNKISNNMSADVKLSKTQLNKITQSGGFLGIFLGRFLPKLIKPAISLGKNILTPLGLNAAMSATDAAIQRKMYGSGLDDLVNILKISHSGLNDMMKIVKVLGDSDILPKGITRTTKNEVKSQRGGFVTALLGGLASSLLGDVLFGSGIKRVGFGIKRAGQEIKKNHQCHHIL